MFTIQFYTSAPGHVPPFPEQGFSLLDGMALFLLTSSLEPFGLTAFVGMVTSIVDNEPANWDFGCVLSCQWTTVNQTLTTFIF